MKYLNNDLPYDFISDVTISVGFVTPPPYFEAMYCFICGRRRVAVARYRMICLVFIQKDITQKL